MDPGTMQTATYDVHSKPIRIHSPTNISKSKFTILDMDYKHTKPGNVNFPSRQTKISFTRLRTRKSEHSRWCKLG
jgi:hypothetical protein